ncbi:hypothetical protein F5X98DRAFT_385306 [Xylaria grammica]|nr:hypothetical protein F5X98DRAFT_385306 [Xylaria grammica]
MAIRLELGAQLQRLGQLLPVRRRLALSYQTGDRNPTLSEMAAVAAVIPGPQSNSARHLGLPAAPPFSMLSNASDAEILAEAADICGIDVDQFKDVYLASRFQEGLAAGNLHSRSAYKACWVYSLLGSVDLERLKNALNTVIARNPVFRTALVYTSKGTMQIVVNMAE